MKKELTERDKKLLVFLGVVIIVFLVGYLGIYPLAKKINTISGEISHQEDEKKEKETEIMQLSSEKAVNEKMKSDSEELSSRFYEEMSSSQIDKMMTQMALDNKLEVYDLSIEENEEDYQLEPYQYSKKKKQEEIEETAGTNASSSKSLDDVQKSAEKKAGMDTDEEQESSTFYRGVHIVNVGMVLDGNQKDMEDFLDILALQKYRIRVKSFSMEEKTSMFYVKDALDVKNGKQLRVEMELYMEEK